MNAHNRGRREGGAVGKGWMGGCAQIFDGRIRQSMNVKMISTLIGQSFPLNTTPRQDQNVSSFL